MDEAPVALEPLIHCTPSSDPLFLASVANSYTEAAELLSGEAALLVGTLVRLRRQYPLASIIPLSLVSRHAPFVVWLVSREGWTELERLSSPPGPFAGNVATAHAPRPGA